MAHPLVQEAFGSTDVAQKGQSYQVWRNNYQRDLDLCLDFHLRTNRTKIYTMVLKIPIILIFQLRIRIVYYCLVQMAIEFE